MKRVADHLSDVLETIQPLPVLDVHLLDSQGCILTEDVAAPWPLPQFDNSAMDGYAVCAEDVAEASEENPVELPVVADIAAGDLDVSAIGPNLSARIMTGAPIPARADAIVPVEHTDGGTARVRVTSPPKLGAHIRRAGEDVKEGEVVLSAGTSLGATQIGLLAAVGRDRVVVRPKPRIVVISTGSELVEPGQPVGLGQIIDSNSFTLTAAAREAGAIAYRIPPVPDDSEQLMSVIEDQLVRADLVITTGGVSKGAYDVVKEVLSDLGSVRFDEVAMQPGKPQGFGTIGEESTPIFTLPGNPVSSFVSFEVFVRPAIRKMFGATRLHRSSVKAVLQQSMRSPEGRRQFARAQLQPSSDGSYLVTPLSSQQSHRLADLAYANALVVVPEHLTEVAAGQVVDAVRLEQRRD
ncbi:molybdopterin molybdenumtransferase MoeA [Actinobacteria bacterium YIM 96077]|uniref:Molybdopterin molybdenumtransferase n=1 Tax=Phytoactinopolyspora halophila TaxID=1981511 RepID=A0A329QXF5_9ACTN|nr:gephyrin-like molybdotransferase Glp [Phytoactinopolyspora halophila]AYY14870.1 molybdopterin molybdenumtransferase MoeA [Actinobacteria bacterium YIM 96077]RAW15328.1 molybdopterin molybdenumtransferase MoeA [Phytoactinopolyspora halophila]